MQAAWAFTVLLPVFAAQSLAPAQAMGPWGVAGGLLFAACWAFEATADLQKNAFKSSDAGKNEFMRTGLFSLCQFPSYAGEIGCWVSMFLWAGFPRTASQHPWIALSPLFTAVLLLHVSGALSGWGVRGAAAGTSRMRAPMSRAGATARVHAQACRR